AQLGYCDLVAGRMCLQLAFAIAQRMICPFDISRTRGADQEKTVPGRTVAEVTQQIDAGAIGPMQIFQKQHYHKGGSEFPQSVSQFAQHTVLVGTNGLALQLIKGAARMKSR